MDTIEWLKAGLEQDIPGSDVSIVMAHAEKLFDGHKAKTRIRVVPLSPATLGQALDLPDDQNQFVVFRDQVTGLEYLRNCAELHQVGLYTELAEYGLQLFLDFRLISASERDSVRSLAEQLGVDWTHFDVEQFTMGVNVELEHGKRDALTNVTDDDPLTTAKIALAHLTEFPDYYTRLDKLEKEADEYWKDKNK